MSPSIIEEGVAVLKQAVLQYRNDLKAYAKLGQIRVVSEGDYLLFSYTKDAAYNRNWLPVERVSRGLIFNWRTTELVALPFPKFFNLGEVTETKVANLPTEPPQVTTKLDGSLGIGAILNGQYRIVTRGSFQSEQAIWATAFVNRQYANQTWPADITFLFEIIYPENQIVVNYRGTKALYLVGAYNLKDYTDYDYTALQGFARQYNFKLVAKATGSVKELVDQSLSLRGVEGWVLRYNNGLRVKVKTAEYLELHRLLSHLSAARIQEAMLSNEVVELIKDLPEEFRTKIEQVVLALTKSCSQIEQQVIAEHQRIRPLLEPAQLVDGKYYRLGTGGLLDIDRQYMKSYASLVLQSKLGEKERGYLFAYTRGREIRTLILKELDSKPLDSLLISSGPEPGEE